MQQYKIEAATGS